MKVQACFHLLDGSRIEGEITNSDDAMKEIVDRKYGDLAETMAVGHVKKAGSKCEEDAWLN